MTHNVYEVTVDMASTVDDPFTPTLTTKVFAPDEHAAKDRVDDFIADHNLVVVEPPEVELVSEDPAGYINGQEA